MRHAVNSGEFDRESEAMLASLASDVGRIRATNEDAYCLCQLCTVGRPLLLAVADGMGGHMDGEVASQLAVRQLRLDLEQHGGGANASDYHSRLVSAFKTANRAVFTAAGGSMGTTLTAGLLLANRMLMAHVGDSRAYLVRRGNLHLLTHDHSLAGMMVRNGEMGEQEAKEHPHRHLLTRALGTEPDISVDTTEFTVENGDVFILCTDGLTNLVQEQELLQAVCVSEELAEVASVLVAMANDRGGTDNATVMAVTMDRVTGEERP